MLPLALCHCPENMYGRARWSLEEVKTQEAEPLQPTPPAKASLEQSSSADQEMHV